jgi:hypothetical protein
VVAAAAPDVVAVLDAVLAVLPLAGEGQLPLQGWLADPADGAAYDVAFTVQGMAADAERRPLRMCLHTDDVRPALVASAAATLHIPAAGSGWVFLLRHSE